MRLANLAGHFPGAAGVNENPSAPLPVDQTAEIAEVGGADVSRVALCLDEIKLPLDPEAPINAAVAGITFIALHLAASALKPLQYQFLGLCCKNREA